MNGIEATHRIREDLGEAAPRVIAVTASVFDSDRELLLQRGFDGLLGKPFREAELLGMLEQHLQIKLLDERSVRHRQTVGAPKLCVGNVIPPHLASRIRAAAIGNQVSEMNRIIDLVRCDYPDQASEIEKLAVNFQYQEIITLLGAD